MSGYGTVAWARAADGRMSRRERIREVAKSTSIVGAMALGRARRRLGLASGFRLDPDEIVIPDSKIATEAEEVCREASSEMLVNHCFRTYVFGSILGARDGLDPDPELFYVASMLHDLALTDSFRDYAPMPCFAARAGILAGDWAAERDWPAERCEILGDAVSLHLNARVPAEHGPEAQLLQAGAGVDVIGLRHWHLSAETTEAVVERYPRLDMKRDGYPNFKAEAQPGTRTQLLDRWLLFGPLTRHSQFAE